MLNFVHKGRTVNLPLDTRTLTGDANADSSSTYIAGLVSGRAVTLTQYGVALYDNANYATTRPVGFLVNDAAGYFFENKPALASGMVSVARGPENVVQTDQLASGATFNPGDLVYVGTGAAAGLLTNTAPSNGVPVGIAFSTASASSAPTLSVALI